MYTILYLYNRTSMTRTPMARLPWLIFSPYGIFPITNIEGNFLILFKKKKKRTGTCYSCRRVLALILYTLINLFWRLNDLRIYMITWYTRPSLMKLIIFLKHVTDVDALIVKILLKLTFLPVGALKRLSKCGFQQVARLRMSFIW